MLNQQPPQAPQAPAPQPQQPEAQGQDSSKGVQGLITGINTDMLKFKEVLMSVPSIPEEQKAQLDSLIQGYQQFVMGLAKAGGQPQAPQAPQAQAPAPKVTQPGGGRMMPMSGGPGAVPKTPGSL